jgi:hypothetical protein
MKKNILRISLAILLLVFGVLICASTAFSDRSSGIDNASSRVYKSEIPAGIKNEEIAKILVKRMMDKYLIGTRGWSQWVWTYKIKEIRLGDNGFKSYVNVEIYVKPLIPDFWANYWTFEVEWVDNGWVRVVYLMLIDDRGEYYELCGPFSGG